jgi:hypothetical protein
MGVSIFVGNSKPLEVDGKLLEGKDVQGQKIEDLTASHLSRGRPITFDSTTFVSDARSAMVATEEMADYLRQAEAAEVKLTFNAGAPMIKTDRGYEQFGELTFSPTKKPVT